MQTGAESKNRKTTMRRRLFLYMLTLAVIILLFLASGLYFLGHFSSTRAKVAGDLSFQMDVYERQVAGYFEDLAMMGTALSRDGTALIEDYLREGGISFAALNDDATRIRDVESRLFGKLREELLKTDCSGAFVILDATVNTALEDADVSRAGLYFARSTLDATDETLLLFRGNSDLGREGNIMPHRKWRLEFRTDLIPGYADYLTAATQPTEKCTYLTEVFTLPGTSERVMQFMVPLVGADGTRYGVCGFEIGESYFKTRFAQPTQISHLTCMLTRGDGDVPDPATGFSAGVLGGYYLAPGGILTAKDIGVGLTRLVGETHYVGMLRTITPAANAACTLTVMLPAADYDRMVADNVIHLVCLSFLLLFATVVSCVVFSRRFLSPLLRGIEQIRRQEHAAASSAFAEIDDLFAYLAEQDRRRDEETDALRRICNEHESRLQDQEVEIGRLAYARKTEVDPDDYAMFRSGLRSLTPAERSVFDLYLSGKTAKEITEILHIRESTLKYHNHNILGKLNVSSRKQMLRYAALLKAEQSDDSHS